MHIRFSVLRCLLIFSLMMLVNAQPVFADIVIRDARGEQRFESVPERVVVLDWDLLEQLLTLQVVPVASAELAGYQQWVVKPAAPDSIRELGTRSEPNLEKIARLKPDVIIAASPQEDLIPILEHIAPVVYLPNFARHDNAATVAIDHLLTLAALFDKQVLAKSVLTDIETGFVHLHDKIQTQAGESPEVVVMRFSTPNSVFFYTENSTTEYVVRKLGLTSPFSLPAQPWGIKQERINRLQYIDAGYVLYVEPFPQADKLEQSPMWQAMPFVRNGHFNSVRSVWNYGGAMSLLYMAEAITDSLLEVAQQPMAKEKK